MQHLPHNGYPATDGSHMGTSESYDDYQLSDNSSSLVILSPTSSHAPSHLSSQHPTVVPYQNQYQYTQNGHPFVPLSAGFNFAGEATQLQGMHQGRFTHMDWFLPTSQLTHPVWEIRPPSWTFSPLPPALHSHPREDELPTSALSAQRYIAYLGTWDTARHFEQDEKRASLEALILSRNDKKPRPGPRRSPRTSDDCPTPEATRGVIVKKVQDSYTNGYKGYSLFVFYNHLQVGPQMSLMQEVEGYLNWSIKDDVNIIWFWVEYNQYHQKWSLTQTVCFRHLITWLGKHLEEFQSVMTAPEDEEFLRAQVYNAFQKFIPHYEINNIHYRLMDDRQSMRLYPKGDDFPFVDHREFSALEIRIIQAEHPQHWCESSRAEASEIVAMEDQ